ncbi:MAG: phospholipase, partial [Chloroflexi bacterium]|nr:phospholipase [Chloroflexota bacterium]
MRAALIVLIACTTLGIAASAGAAGPAPIEHVLVLMQEDRTFDHYFGTYPGANGPPVGLSVPRDPDAPDAGSVEPFKLGVTRTISLPHSEKAMRSAFNDGSVDGFVRAAEQFGAEDGALTMGYYDFEEIPLYWNLADEYVLADNWFSSVMGPSF